MTNRIPRYDTDADDQIENAAVDALINFGTADTFSQYPIANSDLSNSQVTVAGNAVSLGGSTAIDHSDLSSINSDQHHTKYTDEEAQDAVGTILGSNFNYDDPTPEITLANDTITVSSGDGLKNGGSVSLGSSITLDIEPADFAGTFLSDDGSDNLTVDIGIGLENNGTDDIRIDEDTSLTWTTDQTFNGGITMGGTIDMQSSNLVTNLPSPSNDGDAARKQYVDGVAQGLNLKESVRAATDGTNIDLTSATDPNPIDGVTLSDGDRVLLKDQNTASENGIYVTSTATNPTTWTRSADFDEDAEVTSGAFTFVEEGTNNGNTSWIVTTNDPITVDTTAINWSQFASAGEISAGDGLDKSGQTLSVDVSDFAGSGLQDDGGNDLELTNDSVTVAGNTVSLGGSTSIGHGDLDNVLSDQHHTKYTDEEAQDAVGNNFDGTLSYDDATPEFGVADNGIDTTQLAAQAVTPNEVDGSGGSNGDILTTDGTVDGVSWGAPAAGGFTTTVASSDTNASDDDEILADSSSNSVNITLPTPSQGVRVRVMRIASANNVVVERNGTEQIQRQSSNLTLNDLESVELVSDGTDWWIV
jgi:hypothetical protein